jgi:L-lactate permease
VTALFGNVVTFNLVSLVSPVLSAWFAYRLCRYVTGAWLPSLVGGYVFGFSSYELGQMLGHLHLIPIFLVPAAVHLVLLRMDEAVSVRRFVVLLALIFAVQVLISTEVLFASLVFGFAALLIAFWLVPEAGGPSAPWSHRSSEPAERRRSS